MAGEDALDLLKKMFMYDPNLRISAQQALEHRYFTSGPPSTNPALLPRPPPKSKADFNPQEGPTVLSPVRKSRRVMPQREGIEGNAYQVDKAEDQIRPSTRERSDLVLMSIDFSAFGSRPPSRPTINCADRSLLKRKLDLELRRRRI